VPFRITHGYSKDKGPDLKQFVLSMLCVDRAVPMRGKLEDGNALDKMLNTPCSRACTPCPGSCRPPERSWTPWPQPFPAWRHRCSLCGKRAGLTRALVVETLPRRPGAGAVSGISPCAMGVWKRPFDWPILCPRNVMRSLIGCGLAPHIPATCQRISARATCSVTRHSACTGEDGPGIPHPCT
jgi:hypothetical protein